MEEKDKFYIKVSKASDITIKKVTIEITDGGINPKQEDFELEPGSHFYAESVNKSSKDGYINITLEDGSNLMDVPLVYITVVEPKSLQKQRTSGCGGCARRRKELEEARRKKELERQTNGTN